MNCKAVRGVYQEIMLPNCALTVCRWRQNACVIACVFISGELYGVRLVKSSLCLIFDLCRHYRSLFYADVQTYALDLYPAHVYRRLSCADT